MLDKIESLINAPKRYPVKVKEWERALDEDFVSIKKIKMVKKESGFLTDRYLDETSLFDHINNTSNMKNSRNRSKLIGKTNSKILHK